MQRMHNKSYRILHKKWRVCISLHQCNDGLEVKVSKVGLIIVTAFMIRKYKEVGAWTCVVMIFATSQLLFRIFQQFAACSDQRTYPSFTLMFPSQAFIKR